MMKYGFAGVALAAAAVAFSTNSEASAQQILCDGIESATGLPVNCEAYEAPSGGDINVGAEATAGATATANNEGVSMNTSLRSYALGLSHQHVPNITTGATGNPLVVQDSRSSGVTVGPFGWSSGESTARAVDDVTYERMIEDREDRQAHELDTVHTVQTHLTNRANNLAQWDFDREFMVALAYNQDGARSAGIVDALGESILDRHTNGDYGELPPPGPRVVHVPVEREPEPEARPDCPQAAPAARPVTMQCTMQ